MTAAEPSKTTNDFVLKSDENIFTPFNTPFARGIFALCGVTQAQELVGQFVTIYGKNVGRISRVSSVFHKSEIASELPETIELFFEDFSDWVTLSNDRRSGLTEIYIKNPELKITSQDVQVMFGPQNKILNGTGGSLGDEIDWRTE